jgi:hypothetical protein
MAGVSPLEALEDVRRVLPGARPNPLFMGVLSDASALLHPRSDGTGNAAANNVSGRL